MNPGVDQTPAHGSRGSSKGGSVGTTGSRRRGGRRSRARPTGAPNVLARRARRRGLRAARLLRLRHRHARTSTPWPPAGSATPASTPPRSAPPPARACSPAATTTTWAWVASSTSPPASPATTPASRARARCSRPCSRPHGYAAYAVGKWHLTPEDEEHLGASRDRWPLGRGFERWYGFFPGETHQFVPALIHDSHHVDPPGTVRGRLPPHHRPGGPRHRVDRGPAQRRRRQAVAPLPRHRRVPLAAPRAAGVDRALPRPLRPGLGRVARGDARPPEGGRAAARAHRAVAAARLGAGVGGPRRRRARACTRATWRRSPATCRTPTTSSAGCSTGCATLGELDDTLVMVLSDNGASSEGGPTGSLNDARVWNALPAHRGGGGRAPRRDRRAAHPQQLPVGLDGGGQHAVPPLEARDARGRRGRPAHRPLARRHRRARRGAAPVRARHRPAADDPRRHRDRRRRPRSAGVAQRAARRRELPLHLRRRRRARGPHRAALRDARLPGAVPGRVEGGDLPGDPGRRAAPRRGGVGALRPAGRPVGVPRPRRRRARAARGDDRALVGGGRAPPGAARSTTARSPSSCSSARRRWRPALATRTGPAARRCPRAWR